MIPASSQASSELSTASFTVVSSALRGLSKPSKWRFFAKNSLTEMSRCLVAIASAVVRRRCSGAGDEVPSIESDESAALACDNGVLLHLKTIHLRPKTAKSPNLPEL